MLLRRTFTYLNLNLFKDLQQADMYDGGAPPQSFTELTPPPLGLYVSGDQIHSGQYCLINNFFVVIL